MGDDAKRVDLVTLRTMHEHEVVGWAAAAPGGTC